MRILKRREAFTNSLSKGIQKKINWKKKIKATIYGYLTVLQWQVQNFQIGGVTGVINLFEGGLEDAFAQDFIFS